MQSEIMTKYALDISKIEKNLDRIKDARLKQYDLRYTHLMCMVKIRQSKEGLTSTEISHICFIDKAFVSRITNELIQRDLIKTNEKFVVDASLKLSEYMVSNCSLAQFQNIFEKISKYSFTAINYLNGEMKAGERFMEFYPSEESVKKQVVDLFYTKKN